MERWKAVAREKWREQNSEEAAQANPELQKSIQKAWSKV
jgi:hypothetical protein